MQHISNEFWSRWRREILATLQCRQKWNTISRNYKVGDIVLLKEAAPERNNWSMAKIVATNADKNGFVRSVKLMLATSGATNMGLTFFWTLLLLFFKGCFSTLNLFFKTRLSPYHCWLMTITLGNFAISMLHTGEIC